MQAAAETGLPVWLGASPVRLEGGTLGTFPERGDGESFEDLVSGLADPAPDAITVMHAKPEVVLDPMEIICGCFAGPIGAYAETGTWAPPNRVFDGLRPAESLHEATV